MLAPGTQARMLAPGTQARALLTLLAPARVSLAQVWLAQVRLAQVRLAQVRLAQVRLAQVRLAQVWLAPETPQRQIRPARARMALRCRLAPTRTVPVLRMRVPTAPTWRAAARSARAGPVTERPDETERGASSAPGA